MIFTVSLFTVSLFTVSLFTSFPKSLQSWYISTSSSVPQWASKKPSLHGPCVSCTWLLYPPVSISARFSWTSCVALHSALSLRLLSAVAAIHSAFIVTIRPPRPAVSRVFRRTSPCAGALSIKECGFMFPRWTLLFIRSPWREFARRRTAFAWSTIYRCPACLAPSSYFSSPSRTRDTSWSVFSWIFWDQ